jgi:nucleotide-binding universal stress UspA family protein
MRSILIATDLSARSDRAFERALGLASQHQAHLIILHVVDEEQRPMVVDHLVEEARRTIHSDLAASTPHLEPDARIEVRVVAGSGFAEIIRQADDLSVELIVIGSHRTHSLVDLFRGATAERVLRNGRVPVLLVKEHARKPYERVLVAVDFSVHSREAVRVARQVAPAGAFTLLHAFHVPFSGFLDNPRNRELFRQDHVDRMSRMIEEELKTLSGAAGEARHPFKKLIREGAVIPVIREEVQHLSADLLVVGTHGRTGVGHALLGSVAEALLRDPPCDVLAVKAW